MPAFLDTVGHCQVDIVNLLWVKPGEWLRRVRVGPPKGFRPRAARVRPPGTIPLPWLIGALTP